MAAKEDTASVAGRVIINVWMHIGGNPAKLIKKRFSDETIESLMKIDISKWNEEFIVKNIERLYQHVEERIK